MAQLADILIGSTLPLHPYFGEDALLSLQLVRGEKILDETRAVAGDENGIWEIDSPLNLPDTHQPLTLAVVVKTKDSKRRLASAIIRVPDLCVRVKAAPNEYYEFTTCDSCAAFQVVLSCLIKPTKSITMETPPLGPLSEAIPGGSYRLSREVDREGGASSTLQGQRDFWKAAYAQIVGFPPSEKKIEFLSITGRTWHAIYNDSQDVTDLDNAISIQREAVNLGYYHPQQAKHLESLSDALRARYDYGGNRADIEEAIQASQNGLDLTQRDTPERIDLLMQLASNYDFRFKRVGDVADIDVAVLNYSEAVTLMQEEYPHKAMGHNVFAGALELRFERLGDLADLEMAIAHDESAVRLIPDGHPHKPLYYNNLGTVFRRWFERLGDLDALEKAITNLESAVRLTPDGHPDKPSSYYNLGNLFKSRFERLGDLDALEKATTNLESAVKLTPDGHPDKPLYYNTLGSVLRCRFERLGDLDALEKAITNLESAVRLTPDGHPDKPPRYNNLGIVLQRRFERLGDLDALEKAITNLEIAGRLTPDGHPDKPSSYYNLGNLFRIRFERLGYLDALEKATTDLESAVKLTPDGHPDKPSHCNTLGGVLRYRFKRLGDLDALEKAITTLESIVRLTPDGHPEKPSFYNSLGTVLLFRFKRLDDLDTLEKATTNLESAVRLTPDGHPDKPGFYNNLGIVLQRRFERLGDLDALEKAITTLESVVRLTPDGNPDKPPRYNNLGCALQCRFERLGDLDALEKAITNSESAVRLTPDAHPDKVFMTINFAKCYERRFLSFQNQFDLEQAYLLYATAAQSPVGHPQHRFNAAMKWALCAKRMNNSLLPAFKCAIDQLPRIAWLGIPVSEQHSLLENIGGSVREAVAAAIEAEEYKMAAEWVEQGRSIVWQNLLKLRTPLDDLRAVHPKLAAQLQSISQQLDAPAVGELITQTPLDRPQEEIAKSHTRLAIEWDDLVDKIRKLPNFESFLKPKGFDFLVPAAREGPVVILNVSNDRCDALALIPDDNGGASVVPIALENFTFEKSQKLLQGMKDLLKMAGVRDGDTRAQNRKSQKSDPKSKFKSTLRMLWVEVVKPVLDGLAYQPRSSDLPRIWWCATGPLAFLPIHAAGDYDATEIGYKLSDYAVSSYTPTLTAIIDSSYPNPSKDFKLLTVAQPSAPNCSLIPKTMDEVKRIAEVAGGVSIVSITEEEATVERVQRGIRESHWVHLACHGKQDASKPLDSGLILRDGTLKLSTIVQETLSNAEFAFLSACQTAMGDEKVAEESVHLAAGMLLAGYRGVIATMWSIKDDIAPQVTEVVYSRMLKDGKPNRREAAYALHDAVKLLRDSGADFTSWVPFIHIGR